MMTAGQFATARRGGLTGYEAEFVKQKTAAGVPLSAVSRMLGRNIESLRDHAVQIAPRGVSIIIPEAETEDRVNPLAGIPTEARKIIEHVADLCSITIGAMVGDYRGSHEALARQYAMYALRKAKRPNGAAAYSYLEIGRFLNRDHTTVMHGIRAHCKRFDLVVPE